MAAAIRDRGNRSVDNLDVCRHPAPETVNVTAQWLQQYNTNVWAVRNVQRGECEEPNRGHLQRIRRHIGS